MIDVSRNPSNVVDTAKATYIVHAVYLEFVKVEVMELVPNHCQVNTKLYGNINGDFLPRLGFWVHTGKALHGLFRVRYTLDLSKQRKSGLLHGRSGAISPAWIIVLE